MHTSMHKEFAARPINFFFCFLNSTYSQQMKQPLAAVPNVSKGNISKAQMKSMVNLKLQFRT